MNNIKSLWDEVGKLVVFILLIFITLGVLAYGCGRLAMPSSPRQTVIDRIAQNMGITVRDGDILSESTVWQPSYGYRISFMSDSTAITYSCYFGLLSVCQMESAR